MNPMTKQFSSFNSFILKFYILDFMGVGGKQRKGKQRKRKILEKNGERKIAKR
jgi:hypothetical protein